MWPSLNPPEVEEYDGPLIKICESCTCDFEVRTDMDSMCLECVDKALSKVTGIRGIGNGYECKCQGRVGELYTTVDFNLDVDLVDDFKEEKV